MVKKRVRNKNQTNIATEEVLGGWQGRGSIRNTDNFSPSNRKIIKKIEIIEKEKRAREVTGKHTSLSFTICAQIICYGIDRVYLKMLDRAFSL